MTKISWLELTVPSMDCLRGQGAKVKAKSASFSLSYGHDTSVIGRYWELRGRINEEVMWYVQLSKY